jgi:hypothetical protein
VIDLRVEYENPFDSMRVSSEPSAKEIDGSKRQDEKHDEPMI